MQANRAFRSCTRDFWGCMHQFLLFSSVDLSFVLETLRREALADGDESQVFLHSVGSSTCRGFVSRRHLLDLFWVSSGPLLCCFLLLGKGSRGGSMLDINLFREDKGYDPQEIRESQKRRGASVELVDQVIAADKKWRQCECWSFSSPLSVVCAVVQ